MWWSLPPTFTDLPTAGWDVLVVVHFKPAGGEQRKNTEEVVKRFKLSPHFLRLLPDERLGDCLLPLLRLGEGGAALIYLGGE